MDEFWQQALWSLAPTVLVGLLFWYIMRVIIRSDSKERAAYDEILREQEAAERDEPHTRTR